jgi:hypothetical protein
VPTELISLDRILYPDPVAAGMDIYTLASLTKWYRCANDHTTPITVTTEGDYYRLNDGRHRAVASMMAGRKQVLAEVQHGT